MISEMYIGKSEIYSRAKLVSKIELPMMKELKYSKFEGCEWLENEKIKITSQAGGDWISVSDSREHITEIMCHYRNGSFMSHYVNGTNIKMKNDSKSRERLKSLLELDLDKVEVGETEKEVKQLKI